MLELTTFPSFASGSLSIELSYADSDGLGYFQFLFLGPRPELRLVLQVPRLCPETVATARAPESFPLYENLAYLASFLPASIAARADWLLSLVTDAYTLTSHFFISPGLITDYFRS